MSRKKAIATVNNSTKSTVDLINNSMEKANQKRSFSIVHSNNYTPSATDTKFDILVGYGVHVALVTTALNRLFNKGNMTALELNQNVNHTVSKEDLQQEVLLYFVSHSEEWEIDNDGILSFNDNECLVGVFRTISRHLMQFHRIQATKTNFFELWNDNGTFQIVNGSRVSSLVDYVSIDNIINRADFSAFCETISNLDKDWLMYRLDGLSNSKIALAMGVTYKTIRCAESRVRKAWAKFNA